MGVRWSTTHRGVKIHRVYYQGCINYKVDGTQELACSLYQAKKWIDARILECFDNKTLPVSHHVKSGLRQSLISIGNK